MLESGVRAIGNRVGFAWVGSSRSKIVLNLQIPDSVFAPMTQLLRLDCLITLRNELQ